MALRLLSVVVMMLTQRLVLVGELPLGTRVFPHAEAQPVCTHWQLCCQALCNLKWTVVVRIVHMRGKMGLGGGGGGGGWGVFSRAGHSHPDAFHFTRICHSATLQGHYEGLQQSREEHVPDAGR